MTSGGAPDAPAIAAPVPAVVAGAPAPPAAELRPAAPVPEVPVVVPRPAIAVVPVPAAAGAAVPAAAGAAVPAPVIGCMGTVPVSSLHAAVSSIAPLTNTVSTPQSLRIERTHDCVRFVLIRSTISTFSALESASKIQPLEASDGSAVPTNCVDYAHTVASLNGAAAEANFVRYSKESGRITRIETVPASTRNHLNYLARVTPFRDK
jgi:hypothetical protein